MPASARSWRSSRPLASPMASPLASPQGAVVAEVAELDGASAADAALKALGVQPRYETAADDEPAADAGRASARPMLEVNVPAAEAGSAEMGPTPTIRLGANERQILVGTVDKLRRRGGGGARRGGGGACGRRALLPGARRRSRV